MSYGWGNGVKSLNVAVLWTALTRVRVMLVHRKTRREASSFRAVWLVQSCRVLSSEGPHPWLNAVTILNFLIIFEQRTSSAFPFCTGPCKLCIRVSKERG